MPHVVALYRHPVKGFTPEKVTSVTVQADGRIAGDRVLAFRFADAATPDERDGLDYWPKSKGLALETFPGLAALRLEYDDEARRVRIEHDGETLVEAGLDDAGRVALADALTAFVLGSPDAKRLQRPGRLPLVLVGDGETSRFQDSRRGYVSLHSTASIDALSAALEHEVEDRRFRSNVVIGGVDAWDELSWQGEVTIGAVRFAAAVPIVRCLATHANPDTGERDASVLKTLTGSFGQDEPTLGRMLLLPGVSGAVSDASGSGGTIRVGDEVVVG
ncbi:MOSC domain-containing protein [Microbacterium sp. USTB-Y]|uniref:MOSC domain-containing protein n=1 Tax=Microbacterium sp. USTB-Y TaxID=2823692 RepID=UPI00203A565E|nr:MOSC domain-containing protein [Microbacterium sp. USTB-Y]